VLERKFRRLYDDVKIKDPENIDFSMNFSDIKIDLKDVKNMVSLICIKPYCRTN
jgi:hypothetical protein